MAIVQALLALITKSAGRILNAVFGWAVHALFGQTSARDQTMLSAMVGLAMAWPLLLVGIVAPKVAALVLALVPIPRWIPSSVVRLVWLSLAIVVPIAVGLTVAARSSGGAATEPFAKRVLKGFPITLGLAAAFLLMFLSVPVMRLGAFIRRRKSVDIGLITDSASYHHVGRTLCDVLERHGLALRPTAPGWWMTAPLKILLALGGDAFEAYAPRELVCFASPDLWLALYPSGVLLRGEARLVNAAHALITEAIVETDGLETIAPPARALELEIRRIWKGHVLRGFSADRSELRADLADAAHALCRLDADFAEWRALYRQLLQVDRALRGDRQLMEGSVVRASRSVDQHPTVPTLAPPDWAVGWGRSSAHNR